MTIERLDDLPYFLAVVEHQSFTAAARALGASKQLVSRRVGELEQSLGIQLLRRSTRRVVPTDAGAAFAARCRDGLGRLSDAEAELRATDVTPRGRLRLTADQTFGQAFLAPLLAEYLQAHPSVGADVLLTQRTVDLLEEGYDIAIRVGGEVGGALSSTPLGPAEIIYCASPDYLRTAPPLESPADLTQHHCVGASATSGRLRWPFATGAVEIEPRLRANDYGLTKQAILQGVGVGVLPAFDALPAIEAGHLVQVLEPATVAVGAVNLVYARERFPSARARAFIDLAVSRMVGVFS